ncbi:hypothetical protein SCP_0213530 [Sparassis crispa]|uniref:Uncharacterized protein n=1 Tax=Sparassis crispa TaxID=139825 RepID=A0A401GDB4_9APHY|nr:hypothetical protein SCP_0213530 [Sparassis crispa]GBE80150.1 hypothetical protein SCP_0213530 [Sparassis crispa]
MPVTFEVAKHSAEPVRQRSSVNGVQDAKGLLRQAHLSRRQRCVEVLQSSAAPDALLSMEYCGNGFVHAVMRAHGEHHNLVIRPDDVWIAILNQFSFYVNAHAKELRSQFVEHTNKKTVVFAAGTRYTVDFGGMTRQMTEQMRQNVVDETLTGWILPDFTTSTTVDSTICSALMTTTLKSYDPLAPIRSFFECFYHKYFNYKMICICGIPSVTLEGEKEDWLKLLQRVDKLDEFGDEPCAWATMLRPILQRFVSSFDGEPDVEFWTHVVQRDVARYRHDSVSGWIAAFVPWTDQGVWQGGEQPLRAALSEQKDDSTARKRVYSVDGVTYPKLSVNRIPQGYGEVDILLEDTGVWLGCRMVAGHIAMSFHSVDGKEILDTVSPAPHWFLFTTQTAFHASVVVPSLAPSQGSSSPPSEGPSTAPSAPRQTSSYASYGRVVVLPQAPSQGMSSSSPSQGTSSSPPFEGSSAAPRQTSPYEENHPRRVVRSRSSPRMTSASGFASSGFSSSGFSSSGFSSSGFSSSDSCLVQ